MTQRTTQAPTAAIEPDRTGSGFQIAGNAAERYEQFVAEFMLDWSHDLVEVARVRAGERVVDLACGTGFVTRVAATTVGDPTLVVGVDINAHMVAEARRVTGLDVIEASADSTGLPGAGADVVLCQQGLQYVPDARAVLDEAHRLLRPGGRIAVSVWSEFDRNPFRVGQLAAMRPHLDEATARSYETSSVASLGGLDGLASHLRRSGFVDILAEERTRTVHLPPIDRYFPQLIAATPWKDTFDRLTESERDAALDRLSGFVHQAPHGRGCSVQMTVAVATAHTRPPDARPRHDVA